MSKSPQLTPDEAAALRREAQSEQTEALSQDLDALRLANAELRGELRATNRILEEERRRVRELGLGEQ